MKITAQELAEVLRGTVEGNPEVVVTRLSKIEEAGPDAISFFANPKYKNYVYTSRAGILLVANDFKPEKPLTPTLIRVENVYFSMALLQDHFSSRLKKLVGISDLAFIASSAKIGKNVAISPFAVIGENAEIGDDCIIYPHVYVGPNTTIGNHTLLYPGVKIYRECQIGEHCILHANCVIGSDGFGFAPQEDGTYKKIQQLGNVILESHVEVGAGTTIDRATMGSTIIRRGVKLDNLVQIAHNVEIGENTVVAAQAGFAGSTETGKNCQIGGQAGFAGHLKVGDGTRVQAQSGLNRSFPDGNISIGGSPAMNYRDYYRAYALFRRLPEMQKKLQELEKIIQELKGE